MKTWIRACAALLLIFIASAGFAVSSASVKGTNAVTPLAVPAKPETMERQNLAWAGAGTFLSTAGVFQILALSAGYEYYFGENLSLTLGVDYRIASSDNYAGLMSAVYFHPSASARFDFYAGAGFAYGIFINQALKTIDFPAVIGCNFMITRDFGVRLQDKLYLLSLDRLFNELDLAAVYRF